MRRAARRDANEPALLEVARALGAHLVRFESPAPFDWLCGWRGRWFPLELKNPDGRDRLTEAQVLFRADAKLRELPYWIWRTESDVLRDLGARRAA